MAVILYLYTPRGRSRPIGSVRILCNPRVTFHERAEEGEPQPCTIGAPCCRPKATARVLSLVPTELFNWSCPCKAKRYGVWSLCPFGPPQSIDRSFRLSRSFLPASRFMIPSFGGPGPGCRIYLYLTLSPLRLRARWRQRRNMLCLPVASTTLRSPRRVAGPRGTRI